MGSPISEAERYEGPTGRNEIRHRRRIGRTFAIAAHEVTVEQFLAFQEDHDYSRTVLPRGRCAGEHRDVVSSSAVLQLAQPDRKAFLRTSGATIPQQTFADGMRLYAGLFAADRLSTADRSGVGVRLSGRGDHGPLLTARRRRCWDNTLGTSRTRKHRWMLPVGSLKPNDFGLFDMLGNALEWCQDRAIYYPTDRPLVEDAEQVEAGS